MQSAVAVACRLAARLTLGMLQRHPACRDWQQNQSFATCSLRFAAVRQTGCAAGRANWGSGSAPVVNNFVQLIQSLINDAAARPHAFTQLPIMEM